MQNSASYLSYQDLIKKGWFNNQYTELARDLEVLEKYGLLTTSQRTHLLRMARNAQQHGSAAEIPAANSWRNVD